MDVRDDRDAHARRAKLAQGVAALALAALGAVAGALLLRTSVPNVELPKLAPETYFSAEELARIGEFRRVSRLLWAASLAAELAVLGLLAWKARPLATLVSGAAGGRVRAGVAVALVVLLIVWVATLPLGALAHAWRRRFGLSEQGYPAWLWDGALSLAVTAVLLALAVAIAIALAGRLGSAWWLAAGPAFVAIGIVFALVQPVVVAPLFNRFEPLPDARLAADVEEVAARMGVRVETVQVADASRRTTAANAYVAGIGPTKRVVFYDTILDGRFSPPELVAVAAHELAHVERRHVWKGLAWFALLTLPSLFVVARAAEWRGGLTDPAAVPLALLAALALFLATLPVQNAASRRYEAEADWLALEATRDPESAIELERRLVRTALVDPDPPAWNRLLLATHPAPMKRIAMAEVFETRLRGQAAARGGS